MMILGDKDRVIEIKFSHDIIEDGDKFILKLPTVTCSKEADAKYIQENIYKILCELAKDKFGEGGIDNED